MASAESIHVEVAYATPEQQRIVTATLPAGATIAEAIEASRIRDEFPEIDLHAARVGIFGKLKKLSTELHSGDRVEIYRPLIADPKEVRKQRAAAGKSMKKGSAQSD